MDIQKNGYSLSRKWFNFCFENPEKVNPNHTALYFFAVEHCNRLGWKEKFGLPTEMAKEAIGVKSWHTYIKAFNDIVEWGFFLLIEKSKNQYSCNIIALSNFDEALDEALDKAVAKHVSKQQRSTYQSNDSINKLITNNYELLTNNEKQFIEFLDVLKINESSKTETCFSFDEFWTLYDKKVGDKIKLEKKWLTINEAEKSLIKVHIEKYKKSQPDKKFRKDPQTYLNNKSWNDEVIESKPIINQAQPQQQQKRNILN